LGGAGGGADGGGAAAEKHLLQVLHFILLCAFHGQQMKSPLECVHSQKKKHRILCIIGNEFIKNIDL